MQCGGFETENVDFGVLLGQANHGREVIIRVASVVIGNDGEGCGAMPQSIVAIGRKPGAEEGEEAHIGAGAQHIGHHVEKHGVGVLKAHHIFHVRTLGQEHFGYAGNAVVDGTNEERKSQIGHKKC